MLVYLNGSYVDKADARISIDDRGFIFGDGVYEVWRVVEGALFESERHRGRLIEGLRALEIAEPAEAGPDAFTDIAHRLLDANGLISGQATIYAEITRGAAPRTHYFPPAGTTPTVYVTAAPFKPHDAVRIAGARAITMPDIRWQRCDLKTIQLLPNVLGKQRAVASGAIEAIFVRDDIVTEGAHTTVFGVVDGVIRTHPADHRVLPGVTREVVLEIASSLGLPARNEAMTLDELQNADEVFLTGTTMDVMPIIAIDGRRVADGQPGQIAAALYAALAERLSSRGAAIAR
jgi:D-alanine transaminase